MTRPHRCLRHDLWKTSTGPGTDRMFRSLPFTYGERSGRLSRGPMFATAATSPEHSEASGQSSRRQDMMRVLLRKAEFVVYSHQQEFSCGILTWVPRRHSLKRGPAARVPHNVRRKHFQTSGRVWKQLMFHSLCFLF